MKIAYVIIDCDGRDGTAIAMAQVMHRMARRGHEVHLFADVASGADLSLVTWHRVRALKDPAVARFVSFYLNCSRRIRSLREDQRFDIIHSAGCNTIGANVYQIQNIQPAKRAILERNGEFTTGAGLLRRWTRRAYYGATAAVENRIYHATKSDKVGARGTAVHFLPVSLGTTRELKEHYRIPDDAIDVVPNGVDLDRFSPSLRKKWRGPSRQELNVADDQLALLFTGGEWRRKGLHHAIAAMPHVRTPHHPGGAVLVVAGRDAGQEEMRVRAMGLNVADRVRFIGFSDTPERLMAAADVFVFPTYYEAFSLATIEASAAGLPIIAAKTNGTEELIRPVGVPLGAVGENGILVERDARAVADAINRLAADPNLMIRLGERSRQIAEAEYGWDRIADAAERVYLRLAATR